MKGSPLSAASLCNFSISIFRILSASAFLRCLSACLLTLSSSFCLLARTLLRCARSSFSLCSDSAASCFCFKMSSWDLFLNAADGSPKSTTATRRKDAGHHLVTSSFLSSLTRFAFTSIIIKLLLCIGATSWSNRRWLRSSSDGMPNVISGLSFETFEGSMLVFCRAMPLFSTQDTRALSLISAYCGFLSRKRSSQSKVPSSGKQTGNKTSYFPSFGGCAGCVTCTSFCAASCHMRHLKGSGAMGDGPKL
mmetsp:Transcript_74141/g.206078  ORF Transcript_74141/g.206078 Transcript_74141/m.206078 type:complete len:250 (-) Transcript_74141:750-1499(-)